MVTRLRLPPFVATLGMFGVARGLAVWLAERTTAGLPARRPARTGSMTLGPARRLAATPASGRWWCSPCWWRCLLRLTVFGRHCYAVGSNEATARLCGVNVDAHEGRRLHAAPGCSPAGPGVLMFAHGNSGNPTLGEGLELDVIAAVVIGGASLAAGRGPWSGRCWACHPRASQERREPVQRAGGGAVHPDRGAASWRTSPSSRWRRPGPGDAGTPAIARYVFSRGVTIGTEFARNSVKAAAPVA